MPKARGGNSVPRRPGEKFAETKRREEKRKRDRLYDKMRGTPAWRGYDARWEKVRLVKLRSNPLCEMCERDGAITEATEVHHVVPIANGGEIYVMENLMSLCHSCHMRLHAGGGGSKSPEADCPRPARKSRANFRKLE